MEHLADILIEFGKSCNAGIVEVTSERTDGTKITYKVEIPQTKSNEKTTNAKTLNKR